ncbi:DedA family protein [Geobacillus stearothermophilus]|uniref:DedA family protein n=1 Tax=Geobacillus TaxID=129337 RepID=UPI00017E631D|nr:MULTISPECIES: DedA family protein [Geobacillus]NNU87838.1 DedA family protein [Geobacillus sp. MR]ARA97989.1 alkaline phosphatase [Geobacillus thermodenitrificans]ATO37344.1 alkaline phosphatase [Geobacillus thermodenitrificans]KQB94829.1 Alkaline phosphatase-like protein [Geobacillus sp. PA-3]MDF9297358.1 DedA family protein [Geobacillus stearothermophilus]
MQAWITEFMEQFGYIGIFFMIALENIFPPIPSEVILPFGGFMTTYTTLTIPGVIAAATAGSVVGAIVLYGIGRLLSVERLERIVDRWGGWLRVKPEDIAKANRTFQRYGVWAVFLGRMIPLVRSLISIPAGMSKMNIWLFVWLSVLGTLIWNTLLISIGAALGQSWEKVSEVIGMYAEVVYVIIAIIILVAAVRFWKRRRAS